MNIGRLAFTYESLAGFLGLPKGHEITAIIPQSGDDIANQSISILVTGPQLPEHREGTTVVRVEMTRGSSGKSFFS